VGEFEVLELGSVQAVVNPIKLKMHIVNFKTNLDATDILGECTHCFQQGLSKAFPRLATVDDCYYQIKKLNQTLARLRREDGATRLMNGVEF
jgi:hypothetical protein